ncbi:MAG TPA: hypothetical protein VGM21_17125 [Actinomycetota bacterium]|jgi:hypothetical protein
MDEQPLQAGRDEALVAALGLVNRVIQLDTAAEAFLRQCRAGPGSSELAAEGRRLLGAYQELSAALADTGVAGTTAEAVAATLQHHMRLLRTALDLIYRPQTEPVATQRQRLVGLGPTTERLVELRDQLAGEISPDALNPLGW